MLDRALIDSLFAADLPEADEWERRYPARELPAGAHVTRFAPSPTGSVHIGGLYVAMVCRDLARHSGGRYLVRIEDTDQAREVPGALDQFRRAFAYAGLDADESVESLGAGGDHGPYRQSEREAIYHSHARHLLRQGRAYPCFASKDELAALAARQESLKVPTGYYGEWALWRDADPADVRAALDANRPYVVRFRSPNETGRVRWEDAIRGRLEHEANRNDVVLLKSSETSPRLPTYHFAHAVDEHLMRVTTVVRGEEWLSSVPLHLQLFAALGFEPPVYAHVAPLMKLIPGGKRKLSKRHDPEAGVDYYLDAGYPPEALLHYLRGLANGRLAELPEAEALATPLVLREFGTAGPLVDLPKLDDLSADHVARMTGPDVVAAVSVWARSHDPEVADVLAGEPDLALRALAVEREGVDNPRKDLRTWSGFRAAYGFFFPQLFRPLTGPDDERVAAAGLPGEAARPFVRDLVEGYRQLDDQGEWFDQIRTASARNGFAPSPKEYKRDPAAWVGSIREAAQLVRVAVTGSTRSPDLHAISGAIGAEEFLRRLRPLT
jgi:glutamyl-tRNA synthetase